MNRGRPRHDDVLTPREWEVLSLLREGLTNEEIASRLGIAHNTVKYHVSEILSKLDVETREEAAAWRGEPRKVLPAAIPGLLGKWFGGLSPAKLAGAGAIAAAAVAMAFLAFGVLMGNGEDSLGKIAFVRDGNIWVQKLPDGMPYQLTDEGGTALPRWSPSGEWLLYSRVSDDTGPQRETWLIRAGGSDERRLDADGFSAYWLPESDDWLAYYRNDGGVVVADVDGSSQNVLFEAGVVDGEKVERYPYLPSSDGSLLVLGETRYPIDPATSEEGSEPSAYGFWLTSTGGGDSRLLLHSDPATGGRPFVYGWSDDEGSLLFFNLPPADIAERGDLIQDGLQLHAIPLDGGEPRRLDLISVPGLIGAPSPPSASGLVVVDGAGRESWTNKRLVLLKSGTTDYTVLTDPGVAAIEPAWSPDGAEIAYVAAPDLGPDGRDEALALRHIWGMDADGSNQRPITTGEGFRDASPAWSADGRYVLFARLGIEDFCDTSSYDLMRYDTRDGSVDVLAQDLELMGTSNERPVIGEVPACDSLGGFMTDYFGDLNLSPVLNWWQPPED